MRPRTLYDLHTHSTCSDGARPPADLVRHAWSRGLAGLALTDHDTLRGLPEASAAAASYGLTLVPGIELSVRAERRVVHLLGLFFDPDHPGLVAFVEAYVGLRRDRAAAMIERLGRLGLPLEMAEVEEVAAGGILGRPHIARALLKKKLVSSAEMAFSNYLGDDGPAYAAMACPPAAEALAVLHAAGGIGLLAHPGHWTADREIRALRAEGLDGLETIHPAHDRSLTEYYRRLADALQLVESAGTDYHGHRPADERRFGRAGATPGMIERLRRAAGVFTSS